MILVYSKNPKDHSVPFKKGAFCRWPVIVLMVIYCCMFVPLKIRVVYVVFCGKNVNANCCNVLWDICPRLFNFFLTAMLSDLHGMLCERSKLLLASLFKWRCVCTSSALDCFLSMLFALNPILVTVEKNFYYFREKLIIFFPTKMTFIFTEMNPCVLSRIDLQSFIR